jgi:hypothetical protein
MLSFVCLALAAQLEGSPMRFVLLEDFDEPGPGTSWNATLFPDEILGGGTQLVREPLTVAQGAPDTQPPLPINAGGDLEGRLYELTLGGSGYALTADMAENQLSDCAVRGFVAIGAPDPFGSQSVGLLIRASVNPNPPFGTGLNAYTAQVIRNGNGDVSFMLARWRDGVITPPDVFANVPFVASFAQENYLIALHAEGDALLARLWRVRVQSGSLVVEPVLLAQSPNGKPTNTIGARDGELVSGRIGVDGFARGGNSVFWEDVQLGLPPDRLAPLPNRAPAPASAPGR